MDGEITYCPRCAGSGYDPMGGGAGWACMKCQGEGVVADFDPHPDDPECWFDPATPLF